MVLCTLFLSTLMFSSCGIFKKYEPAQQPEQDSLITAVSDANWQTYITDPILQGHIRKALENNVDYRSRKLAVLEADARLRAAKLGFLPTFDAELPSAALTQLGWRRLWNNHKPQTAGASAT